MKIGIASYKRPKCRTASTLLDAGISPSDIYIGVQTEEDYKEYSDAHQVNVIYAPSDCAGGNRNNLIKSIDDELLLLDDDITSFAYWNGQKYITDTKTALKRMLESLQGVADEWALAGVSPTANGLIRKSRSEISYLTLLQGTVLFVKDKSLLFNEKWKMVEDYEISLRAIRMGLNTIRLNNFVANKPKNGSNAGGLHERYANNELPIWITRLSKVYPEFKPNKDKTGGYVKL